MFYKMNKANEHEEINRSCLSNRLRFVSVFYTTCFNHILFNEQQHIDILFWDFFFFLFQHLSSSGCICWVERELLDSSLFSMTAGSGSGPPEETILMNSPLHSDEWVCLSSESAPAPSEGPCYHRAPERTHTHMHTQCSVASETMFKLTAFLHSDNVI